MISFIYTAHAAASDAEYTAQCLVNKINDVILFPLIALMMAIAFIFFLYGAFEYVKNSNNETARETGRNHLMYGVIGMLVMLSAHAILSMAAGTFSLPLFPSDTIVCGAGAAPAPTVAVGGFGSGPTTPTAPAFGGATLPDGSTPSAVPTLVTPTPLRVDSLPSVDPTAPPCPPGKTRISGNCTVIYPFEVRNNQQIEVSCLGDASCIGAIQACINHYGGDINTIDSSGNYMLCSNSNFSQGPVSVITYANAPAGMFTPPPELAGYHMGIDAPPLVASFQDSVRVQGANTFVTPEFAENLSTYVTPYVVENSSDQQAVLDAYGSTVVFFMMPQTTAQVGGTVSQGDNRCKDLTGHPMDLESGNSMVTSIPMLVCTNW